MFTLPKLPALPTFHRTTRRQWQAAALTLGLALSRRLVLLFGAALASGVAQATPDAVCKTQSGATIMPVVELYTSEGCSSCPPADQWLSGLKGKAVVAQAFHVGYWDYIGWVDRFASTANTQRQREVATLNHLSGLYTPQIVKNGRDWRGWSSWLGTGSPLDSAVPARASISLQRNSNSNSDRDRDSFSAQVSPTDTNAKWGAYWSVTENGHSSRVKAGENAGEFLQHDFVVRQYTPVGRFSGTQQLSFFAIAPTPGHVRNINLVVFDTGSGETLQSVSLRCD
jgi:hypothetical protein